jgi:hypothetical protein
MPRYLPSKKIKIIERAGSSLGVGSFVDVDRIVDFVVPRFLREGFYAGVVALKPNSVAFEYAYIVTCLVVAGVEGETQEFVGVEQGIGQVGIDAFQLDDEDGR